MTRKKRPVARKKTPKRKPAKKKVAKKKATKRTGRPSKFKPEFKKLVEQYASLGATDEQMAGFLGVTTRTFNNWKKTHPDFFHALKDAKTIADDAVERSLFQRATGYSHPEEKVHFDKFGDVHRADTVKHYAPDTTACIFWLKNRRPDLWRDKIETEHSGEIRGGLVIAHDMSEAEWLEAAEKQQALMKRGASK